MRHKKCTELKNKFLASSLKTADISLGRLVVQSEDVYYASVSNVKGHLLHNQGTNMLILFEVEEKYIKANPSDGHEDVSYTQCLDEVRAKRIKEKYDKYDDGGKDPVVLMITEWYDQFKEYESKAELIPVFEKQVRILLFYALCNISLCAYSLALSPCDFI